MSAPKFDAAAWIDQAAPLMGVSIDPAWQTGVAANLQRMAELAALVMAEDLGDHEDAAPVYRP